MSGPEGVAVLGCTGSIGGSTLDVLARHRDKFKVTALAAKSDVSSMLKLCHAWDPLYVAMADSAAAAELRSQLPGVKVLAGNEGISELVSAPEHQVVVHGISGAVGLQTAMDAVRCGKRLLLANKESLVMAGPLLLEAADRHGACILPLDSEHNAALQCLPAPGSSEQVESLTLTASGGGLRDVPLPGLARVSPEQACSHPNWAMGAKITIDSATMMNKGLEVIEACYLFDLPPGKVRVLVHPQSIVHAMVQYCDGSVLAHLAWPDMRTPVAYALSWPHGRCSSGVKSLDLAEISTLEFFSPDYERYPCLKLAQQALAAGAMAPVVLNAANEVAVQAFLDTAIAFTGIAGLVADTMDRMSPAHQGDMAGIMAVDAEARKVASELLAQRR